MTGVQTCALPIYFVLAEGQQVNNQDDGSFIGGTITPTTALAPVLTAANAASSIFGSSI